MQTLLDAVLAKVRSQKPERVGAASLRSQKES